MDSKLVDHYFYWVTHTSRLVLSLWFHLVLYQTKLNQDQRFGRRLTLPLSRKWFVKNKRDLKLKYYSHLFRIIHPKYKTFFYFFLLSKQEKTFKSKRNSNVVWRLREESLFHLRGGYILYIHPLMNNNTQNKTQEPKSQRLHSAVNWHGRRNNIFSVKFNRLR